MNADDLIPVRDFCVYHHIEISFVQSLEQRGLVETTTVEQSLYVLPSQVARLEKLVRLHQELEIHADDLDVVSNLLDQVEDLQQQVTRLQNQLSFYRQLM
jgi:division protein CdvB (Snf7/Vps24/ESCRT-III family)